MVHITVPKPILDLFSTIGFRTVKMLFLIFAIGRIMPHGDFLLSRIK